MKKLLIITTLLSFSGFGQESLNSIIKPRITENNTDLSKENYKISIDNINLYEELIDDENLRSFHKIISDKKFLNPYKHMIFRSSEKVFYLKQWSVPIVIFFDKEIPEDIQKKLIDYYKQVNSIKNLSIKATKDISKANYFIKITNEEINGYDSDYEFRSEEERINNPLTNGNYNLMTDNNMKLFCGTLTINPKGKTNDQIVKQLKQLIFLSLGQFYISILHKENSILSKNYNNSEILSDENKKLLELHYSIIYPQKINLSTFNTLVSFIKNKYE